MRQRDWLWVGGKQPRAATDCEVAGEEADVEGVVRILADRGLTGKDCAAIFAHTPVSSRGMTSG